MAAGKRYSGVSVFRGTQIHTKRLSVSTDRTRPRIPFNSDIIKIPVVLASTG